MIDFINFISSSLFLNSAELALIFLSLLIALSSVVLSAKRLKKLRITTERANNQDATAGTFVNPNEHNEVSELAPGEKQFRMLEKYHDQVISQSNFSFWFSIIFAAVGFMVIIFSVVEFTTSTNTGSGISQYSPAILKLVAGTIIDATSAILFLQSNKARESMSEFFDKLRTDRRMEEALNLTNSLTDDILRDKLKTVLALEFVNIKASTDLLPLVLPKEEEDATPNL